MASPRRIYGTCASCRRQTPGSDITTLDGGSTGLCPACLRQACSACRARDHRLCSDGSTLSTSQAMACACPCAKAPVPLTERAEDAWLDEDMEDRLSGGGQDYGGN